MGDRTRKERIIIENIRVKLEISLIEDKMSKNRLRWNGNIHRRSIDVKMKRIGCLEIIGSFRMKT